MKVSHPYHLVNPSPWPIIASFSLLALAAGFIMFMHKILAWEIVLPLGVIAVSACLFMWWRDVVFEGRNDQSHTAMVRQGLRIGMAIFILTEIMFFFGFFWSFFDTRLFPNGILDGVWVVKNGVWPPEGITTFNPWELPLLNTIILLLSGTTVTWAHYSLKENNKEELVRALKYTIFLGISFTMLQAYEYHHATFAFSDGIYASNFYMTTGFHGAHVIIGTIFLIVCYFRAKLSHFDTKFGHLGFEFAAWYWHFVDVVWVFLFIFVYVLGK